MKFLMLFANLVSMYKVVWQNHHFDIPLNDNTSNYYDLPKPILYDDDNNILNEKYYITKGVKNTFLSVVNSKYVRKFEVIYRVNYYELGLTHEQTIVFNIVDVIPPEFIYIPSIIEPVGSKLLLEKDIIKDLIYKDNYYSNDELVVSIKGLNLVNINVPGEYEIIYEIIDPSNNINRRNELYVIKNNTIPEIIITDPIIHEVGDIFDYHKHIKINDYFDTNILVEIIDYNVNYNLLGNYLITFNISNDYGFKMTKTVIITVKDSKIPELVVVDNYNVNIYDDDFDLRSLIVSISDNYDYLNVSDVLITGYFDSSIIGKYEVFYKVFDSSGNFVTDKSIINVKDLDKPTIDIVKDLNVLVFSINVNYYNYFLIKDNYDDFSDLKIEFNDKNVNYKVLGSYAFEVTVIDSSKNKKIIIYNLNIIDNIPPTIEQVEDIYITNFNDIKNKDLYKYFDLEDNYDSLDNLKLEVVGSYNFQIIGDYNIIIKVLDRSDNYINYETVIKVIDIYPPTLILSNNYYEHYIGMENINYYEYIFDYYDNYSNKNNLKLEINDNVNYELPGFYLVEVIVSDESGNSDYDLIKVIVISSVKEKLIIGNDLALKLNDTFTPFTNIEFSENVIEKNHSIINVDTNIPGTYEVIYYATDNFGNNEYYIQTIIVKNNEFKAYFKENILSIIINVSFGIVGLFYFVKKHKGKKNFDN